MVDPAIYMQRAITLASRAGKDVKSNPKVGCVIVSKGRIIGEGFHQKYGESHAEVNAIAYALSKGHTSAADWEIYVTLEPCAHYGKTPPCALKLVELNPAKVIIGALDQNPQVNGAGVRMLEQAGITTAFLPVEGLEELTKVFYTNLLEKRPYTVLKWAQTAAGMIGSTSGRLRISNEISNKLVHSWRSEADAILIGGNTLIADNPQLNVRLVPGQDPKPVVITSKDESQLLDRKLFSLTEKPILINPAQFEDATGELDWHAVLAFLYKEYHICRLLVEGGAKTLSGLISQGCADEIRVIENRNFQLAGDVMAPMLPQLKCKAQFSIISDNIHIYNIDNKPII